MIARLTTLLAIFILALVLIPAADAAPDLDDATDAALSAICVLPVVTGEALTAPEVTAAHAHADLFWIARADSIRI